jgi:hypothetical protein
MVPQRSLQRTLILRTKQSPNGTTTHTNFPRNTAVVTNVKRCSPSPLHQQHWFLNTFSPHCIDSHLRHATWHQADAGVPLHLALPPCSFCHSIKNCPDHVMICNACNKQPTMRHSTLAPSVLLPVQGCSQRVKPIAATSVVQ